MDLKINKTGFLVGGGSHYLHIVKYGEKVLRFVYSEQLDLPPSTAAVVAKPSSAEPAQEGERLLLGSFCLEVNRESLAVKTQISLSRKLSS